MKRTTDSRTGSQKRRGAKEYLLSKGVKFGEIRAYLLEFFTSYGHTGLEERSTQQLLELASLFFRSLDRYTNGRIAKKDTPGGVEGHTGVDQGGRREKRPRIVK